MQLTADYKVILQHYIYLIMKLNILIKQAPLGFSQNLNLHCLMDVARLFSVKSLSGQGHSFRILYSCTLISIYFSLVNLNITTAMKNLSL